MHSIALYWLGHLSLPGKIRRTYFTVSCYPIVFIPQGRIGNIVCCTTFSIHLMPLKWAVASLREYSDVNMDQRHCFQLNSRWSLQMYNVNTIQICILYILSNQVNRNIPEKHLAYLKNRAPIIFFKLNSYLITIQMFFLRPGKMQCCLKGNRNIID